VTWRTATNSFWAVRETNRNHTRHGLLTTKTSRDLRSNSGDQMCKTTDPTMIFSSGATRVQQTLQRFPFVASRHRIVRHDHEQTLIATVFYFVAVKSFCGLFTARCLDVVDGLKRLILKRQLVLLLLLLLHCLIELK